MSFLSDLGRSILRGAFDSLSADDAGGESKPEGEYYGITETELDDMARSISRGVGAHIDDSGTVIFTEESRSGKTRFTLEMEEDEYGNLRRPNQPYYPGQWRDAADIFAERVNDELLDRALRDHSDTDEWA